MFKQETDLHFCDGSKSTRHKIPEKIVIVGLYHSEDKILLIERQSESDLLYLPGGTIDFHPSPEKQLANEVLSLQKFCFAKSNWMFKALKPIVMITKEDKEIPIKVIQMGMSKLDAPPGWVRDKQFSPFWVSESEISQNTNIAPSVKIILDYYLSKKDKYKSSKNDLKNPILTMTVP